MIRLKDTKHPHTAAFLTDAIQVAEYYGFISLDSITGKRHPVASVRESDISFARRDERTLASGVRASIATTGGKTSLLSWRVVGNAGKGGAPSIGLELHVHGLSGAIAEALLIAVSSAIAESSGLRTRVVSINSIGTPDSSNRYVRDVGVFLKKHIESISPTLRPKAAEDPLGTLVQLIEKGHPATSRAPQGMEYLTEEERRRFWDLLEYLEVGGISYELNPHVLGSRDCWAHTLFSVQAIDEKTGERVAIAHGGRNDPLASRYLGSRAAHASATIICEARGKAGIKKNGPKKIAPVFYFAHLGPEARRKVIPVLEMLRRSDILVHQSLTHEKIGEQMTMARTLEVPYLLIMGHKEAVENTMLVREVATNSQKAIELPDLAVYLRRQRAWAN